jgi:hypothetical protein
MDKHVRTLLLVGLWMVGVGLARAQAPLSDENLVAGLRRGGCDIYLRHAGTDWSVPDQVVRKGDWFSCDARRMRQLTPEGRALAAAVGKAIRRLDLPVDGVFASEYCRARKTARLLKLGPVVATADVINMRAADFVGVRQALILRARRALATPPPHGTNRIFVAHGNLLHAVSEVYAAEAGAALFLPRDDGRSGWWLS